MKKEMFETVDYELIAEIESQQFSLPKFDVGATYNVDTPTSTGNG